MHQIRAIKQVLALIEQELTGPLRLEALARRARMSLWHFQRTFTAMVGEPAGSYLRRRRLTEAARALRQTDRTILDVALDYQFESHEAFTRAFKSEMGVTPSAWRSGRAAVRGGRPRHCLTRTSLNHHFQHMKLTPEIVTLPARRFAGLQSRFISAVAADSDNLQVIPRLWQSFFARVHEIEPAEPGVFYGLCECGDALGEETTRPDEIFYLASAPLAARATVPKGMTTWMSPAGTYARFIHRGRVERIGETVAYIYGKWLPTSSYESGPGPDLERYDSGFDPHSDTSILEIYVPLRPAHKHSGG